MIASMHTLVFPTPCAPFSAVVTVVMDTSVDQHGMVLLYFRFPPGGAVVGEDDQFHFALSDHSLSSSFWSIHRLSVSPCLAERLELLEIEYKLCHHWKQHPQAQP